MASTGARLTVAPKGGKGAKGAPKGNPYNNPLYQPTLPLSGKPLAQAAGALADAQTRPAINQYQNTIRQNNQNTAGETRTDFGYYMQLAQSAKDAVAQSQSTNANLQTTLQGIGANTQSQLAGIGQAAQGGALGRLGALGLSGDSLGQLQAQTAAGQGSAAQLSQNAQNYGAITGANNLSEANSLRGATGLAGTEQIGALTRANAITNRGLRDQINQQISQRGTDYATALGQLRQQEQNFGIAAAGVNYKNDALAQQARDQAARNKIALQQANTSAKQAATSAASAKQRGQQDAFNSNPLAVGSPAWQRVQSLQGSQFANNPNAVGSAAWARVQTANARNNKNGNGGAKPLTTEANDAANTHLGNIVEAIAQWQQDGMKDKKGNVTIPHPTNSQMQQRLGLQYDPNLVQAAFELKGWGYITKATAALLNREGIRSLSYKNGPVKVVDRSTLPPPRDTTGGIPPGIQNPLGPTL